jgi:hypothetical protein
MGGEGTRVKGMIVKEKVLSLGGTQVTVKSVTRTYGPELMDRLRWVPGGAD